MEAIYQSFVTFDWWGLCVTICNLLITFLIVKKFLFGPINKMLGRPRCVSCMQLRRPTAPLPKR